MLTYFCFLFFLKNNSNNKKIMILTLMFFYLMNKNNMHEMINKYFFSDKISMLMNIMLILVYMSVMMTFNKNKKKMNQTMLIYLFYFLFFTFFSYTMIQFYIFFELSLIPLMMLILMWGYQPERIQAFFYLVFYTLLSSFPILLSLTIMNKIYFNKWMLFFFLNNSNYNFLIQTMNLILLTSFLIKLPMYYFHLWLPKAHVEAPVNTSMILASILLKISGFGIYRMCYFLNHSKKIINFFIIALLMSAIYSSMICLNQMDMKAMIAYSSISHMSMMMTGFLTLLTTSSKSSIILMISHGFCSNILFFMSNFFYDQSNSRQLTITRNMNFLIMVQWMWAMYLCFNFSLPPSLSFFSEMMLILILNQINFIFMILILISSFFVASFNIYLLTTTLHNEQFNFFSLQIKHTKVIFLCMFYLYFLLFPIFILNTFWQ